MSDAMEGTNEMSTTTARLERKRQINRLSAQRKRIREKHMMKVLTEKCNELVANRKVLESERDKLMSFLSIVKAKADTSEPIERSTPDYHAIQDKSEVIDFVAKGLLDLANSGVRCGKETRDNDQKTNLHGGVKDQDTPMTSVEEPYLDDLKARCDFPEPKTVYTEDAGGSATCSDINPGVSQLFQLVQGRRAAEEAHMSASNYPQYQGGTLLSSQQMQDVVGNPSPQLLHRNTDALKSLPEAVQPSSSFSPISPSQSATDAACHQNHAPSRDTSDAAQALQGDCLIMANILNLQRNLPGSNQGATTELSATTSPEGIPRENVACHSYFSSLGRASDDIRSPEPSLQGNYWQSFDHARSMRLNVDYQTIQPSSQDALGQQNQEIPQQQNIQCIGQDTARLMNQSQFSAMPTYAGAPQVSPEQLQWALAVLVGHLAKQQGVNPQALPGNMSSECPVGVSESNGVHFESSGGSNCDSNIQRFNQKQQTRTPSPVGTHTAALASSSAPGVSVSPSPQSGKSPIQAPSLASLIPQQFSSTDNAPHLFGPADASVLHQDQQKMQLQLLAAMMMQQAASAIASGRR